ncbi:MAG TPA: bifunctional diaminohydroxyphosphoribosylaminopyrimidine deaminase/5-amino-6-(5-phosphoribosylamino)uracil reductase RibD [Pseudidiomarina sp.]|nr:bifunctional diaminohydroxyphosphoribosylaminopyrimidine deaminase/5-amino-6-(5-phosphoribosylamino)uracil reductase RibD [Pseudidiomarina sp.]
MTHQHYMQMALELAARGRYSTGSNPQVGCVIVAANEIVGSGWHERPGEPHAEVYALREAGSLARGATVYVTLEPCSHFGRTPPCADALIDAGVGHVVIAQLDPNPLVAGRGVKKLQAAGIGVEIGVLESAARALNCGFRSRMERGRPWLRMKLAATLDGRTALANGKSQWITGAAARLDVHDFRARSGAILSTARTVTHDQARLTARSEHCEQQPLRVIIDSQGILRPDAAVFQEQSPILMVQVESVTTNSVVWPNHVEFWTAPSCSGRVDLTALLAELGHRQINDVWTECGAELAGSLMQADLIDEWVIYLAPKLFGNSARGLVDFPAIDDVVNAPEVTFTDVRQIGADIRILAMPRSGRGE